MSKTQKISWFLAFVIFLVAGIYFARQPMQSSMESAVVETVTKGFSEETAHTRFISYASKVSPLKRIELAKLNQLEFFERTSQAKLFWKMVNLPEVVVRASVPVEYRYYVDLNEEWKIEMKDNTLTVVAPALKPGTPSPDISQLRFEVRKGSVFRNEVKVARDLQNEITGFLETRAQQAVVLVRQPARLQIEELAKQWLSIRSKASADRGALCRRALGYSPLNNIIEPCC